MIVKLIAYPSLLCFLVQKLSLQGQRCIPVTPIKIKLIMLIYKASLTVRMHHYIIDSTTTQTKFTLEMMKLVVLTCMMAMAAAGSLIAPLPLAYSAPFAYTAPLLKLFNYRGPLSLAPGQPANIIAADGRPLDTLDVNLDKSAHFTAKALSGTGFHLLKKRSAPVIAPLALKTVAVAPAPLIAHAPLPYSTPLLSSHIAVVPTAYVHAPLVHW